MLEQSGLAVTRRPVGAAPVLRVQLLYGLSNGPKELGQNLPPALLREVPLRCELVEPGLGLLVNTRLEVMGRP